MTCSFWGFILVDSLFAKNHAKATFSDTAGFIYKNNNKPEVTQTQEKLRTM